MQTIWAVTEDLRRGRRVTRSETITITDAVTHATLDSQTISNFHNGVYTVWNIQGHVTIQVTNNAGSLNGVVSGLFFKNPMISAAV